MDMTRRNFFIALAASAVTAKVALPVGFPREMRETTYYAADYIWGEVSREELVRHGQMGMQRAIDANNLTPIGELKSYWSDRFGNPVSTPTHFPGARPSSNELQNCPFFCSSQRMLVPA